MTVDEFFNNSEFATEQDGTPVQFDHMQVYTAKDMCEFAEAYAQYRIDNIPIEIRKGMQNTWARVENGKVIIEPNIKSK